MSKRGEQTPGQHLAVGSRGSLFLLLLLVIVPLLLAETGVLAYVFTQRRFVEAQDHLADSRAQAVTFAQYIHELGRHESLLGAALSLAKSSQSDEASRLLAEGAKGYPAVESLELTDAAGRVIAASNAADVGANIKDSEYFPKTVVLEGTFVSDLFMQADKPVFAVCRALHQADGKVVGVIFAIVSAERLGEAGLISQEQQANLSLFDRQGREVYAYPPRPLDWQQRIHPETGDILQTALAGREAVGAVHQADEKEDFIAARVPVPEIGWAIGVGHPERLATAPLVKAAEVAGGIDLGILALAVGVALVMSRRMSIGFKRLDDRVQQQELLLADSREQTQFLHRLLDNAPIGIAVVDARDGKYVLANPSFQANTGRAGTQFVGHMAGDLSPAETGRFIRWILQHVVKTRTPFSVREYEANLGPGREHTWWNNDVVPLLDQAGNVEAVLAITMEVSDYVLARRQIEQAKTLLQDSQTRLLHLAQNVGEVYWIGPADGNQVQFVNQAYEEVWGRSCQSLYDAPRSWLEAVVEEDKPAVVAALGDGIFGRQPKSLPEYRIRRPDGSQRWISARSWPILDDQGRLISVAGIAEDITTRKRVEEAEEQYRILAEDALIGVCLVQDGKLVYVNPRVAEMFGYTQPEMLSLDDIMEMVLPDDRATLADNMRMSGQRAPNMQYTFRGIRKDGQVIDVEALGSFTSFNGRPAIIGTLLDITERKRTEQELSRTATELARSNQDLERFAGIISHDLQEPLRMISSFLQLLGKRPLGAEEREFIGFAVDGAERMKKMIRDLLAFARIGQQKPEMTALSMQEALDQAVANLKTRIESTGAVITNDPLPNVTGNLSLLSQVFQNLIANAIKFHSEQSPAIHVGAKSQPGKWLFWVSDNGIGIEPEHHDRIFQIFQRLHTTKEYSGSGIGLAVCKRIVQIHGGDICVESTPGQGATFYFTIPDHR